MEEFKIGAARPLSPHGMNGWNSTLQRLAVLLIALLVAFSGLRIFAGPSVASAVSLLPVWALGPGVIALRLWNREREEPWEAILFALAISPAAWVLYLAATTALLGIPLGIACTVGLIVLGFSLVVLLYRKE